MFVKIPLTHMIKCVIQTIPIRSFDVYIYSGVWMYNIIII